MKSATPSGPRWIRPFNTNPLGITHQLAMNNKHKIPQLGFGTYCLHPDKEAEEAVSYAIECGYRHFDCAKAYRNQKAVGAALAKGMKTRRIPREDMFITSKLWPTDQRPDLVEAACRETLAELQLDYLDLYLIHWPVCWKHPEKFETDEDKYPRDAAGLPLMEEGVTLLDTWRAMCNLVDKGLVRSIGLSNCNIPHIKSITEVAEPPKYFPALNQIEVHPACLDLELIGYHNAEGILTGAYCPLGVPKDDEDSKNITPFYETEVFLKVAEHCGYSPQRLALNWNLDRRHVVLVRSAKKEHIKANAKAALFTLDISMIAFLNLFHEKIVSYRVINPKNFTKDGGPFFRS